jgi:cellulose synthase operon protein B
MIKAINRTTSIFILIAAPLFLLQQAVHAETIKLPLQKFTSANSLDIRCVSGGQNLSIPIPARWDVHKLTLSLRYTVSNNMIGDISQMAIRFNGEQVTQLKLVPQAPSVTAEIPVPVNLVEPGYNLLTFQVAQHYQTSACEQPCSPDLWTNISVRESTLQIDYDLKALPLHMGEAVDMVFDPKQFPERTINLVTDVSTPESVTLAGVVASGIARHFDYRKVKFSHSSDIVQGMDNVLIGTTKFAGDVLAPHGVKLASADGGLIKLLYMPADGGVDDRHALLVVSGNDAGPLKIAAETFANMSMPYPGTDEVHAYEFSMPDISMYAGRHVLSSDKLYSFETLGMPTYSFYGFNGKPTRKGFVGGASEISFRLPPDFLIKQNQYAKIKLNFSYGAGMRPDSALSIAVNDVQVRDIHLDNTGGNYIDGYELDIPTYLFKPGGNTISFKPFMNIQRQVCDAVNTEGLFTTIYGNSTLYFPSMPHFVEMPKLELFALNGFPFTRWPDGYQTLVYMPKHDNASIDTALDLIGMITQRNGFPLFGTRVVFAEPKDWQGEMLVVGRTEDIPKSIMDLAPLKADGVSTVPYPVNRGWETETSIAFSKQKSALGEGSGLLMEFESPFKKGRSIVLATAQDEKDMVILGDALLQPGVQARMKGDLELISFAGAPDYDVSALSVGRKYSTGDKGNISFLDSFFYAHPYILYAVIVLSIIALAWLGFRMLRRTRASRTRTDKAE